MMAGFHPPKYLPGVLQDVPKEFILEGFQAKPKGPKAPNQGVGTGGGDSASRQNGGEGQGQSPPPQEKKKQQKLCLLGTQAAVQYGIVFSTLRYVR